MRSRISNSQKHYSTEFLLFYRSLCPSQQLHSSWAALLKRLFLQNDKNKTFIIVSANSRARDEQKLHQQSPSGKLIVTVRLYPCRCGSACDTAAGSLCSTRTAPRRRRATRSAAPAPADTDRHTDVHYRGEEIKCN